MEMVINGVSTRNIRAVVEELRGAELSNSTVSEQGRRLDPFVKVWNERDLSEKEYPFLLVNALAIKVRKGGRVLLLPAALATLFFGCTAGALPGRSGDSERRCRWCLIAFMRRPVRSQMPLPLAGRDFLFCCE